MTKLTYSVLLLLVVGCGSYDINVDDSEQKAYVSVAETWREVCEDRFNEYDYPNAVERGVVQAECRRIFATGEEVLDIHQISGSSL